MSYSKISYTVSDDIATITIDDPATLNAAGIDTVGEMLRAFEQAADEARCTILTGAGRGFCSGANLSTTNERNESSDRSKLDAGAALATHYNPLVLAMKEHPHPIITAVNGPAAGVGCSFALMGDIILAARSAYFLQAFRRIGLVPDGGSTFLLTRMIGRARAMEMGLLGDKIPAETALEWGMINRVVDDGALMDEAQNLAQRLAKGPTEALSLMRQLFWESEGNSFEDQLRAERLAQRTAGRTQDFAEGVKAFLEKRPANFTGN